MKKFVTDGCSGGMSWFYKHIFNKTLPWEEECILHDKKYWLGGTKIMRKAADRELLVAVANKGYPYIAILMFIAVRIFGCPYLPLPWRWGFGYKYFHNYEK